MPDSVQMKICPSDYYGAAVCLGWNCSTALHSWCAEHTDHAVALSTNPDAAGSTLALQDEWLQQVMMRAMSA